MAGLFGGGSASTAANPTQGDTSKDVQINTPPSDSISEIAFSPSADILAASSWDGSVYVWQIDGNGQSTPATSFKFDAPALCCTWSQVRLHKHDTAMAIGAWYGCNNNEFTGRFLHRRCWC